MTRPSVVPENFELLDLHNHTATSRDAVNRLEDYERAFAAGLFDVLAITDHNAVSGACELREEASFPVIVGQEIDTADGELIGLFLEQEIPAGLGAIETAGRIRAQGALVYAQHPFFRLVRRPLKRAALEALAGAELIDIVEVANGNAFTTRANQQALAWAKRKGLPGGAGSDAHEPPAIGSYVIAVPPGELRASSLPARLWEGVVIDRRKNSFLIVAGKVRHRFLPAAVARLQGRP